jgi:hypothetical protein
VAIWLSIRFALNAVVCIRPAQTALVAGDDCAIRQLKQ